MSMRSMYVKVYDFVNIALKENLCIHTQTHTYTLSCLHFFKQNLAYKNVYIYAGLLKFKFLFQVSIRTWFWAVSVISFNGGKVVLPSLVVDVQACKVLNVQVISRAKAISVTWNRESFIPQKQLSLATSLECLLGFGVVTVYKLDKPKKMKQQSKKLVYEYQSQTRLLCLC